MANSWLRLWHDMPNDPKWRTIARASGKPISLVLAIFTHLLVDASQNVTRGHVTVTHEDLASALDVTEEEVRAVLDAMQGRVLDGDRLTGWEARQPKREDSGNPETGAKSASERKREQRERQRNANLGTGATPCHDESRKVTTDKDKEENRDNTATPDGAAPAGAKLGKGKPLSTLSTYLHQRQAEGKAPFDEGSAVDRYPDQIGLPDEMATLCWREFRLAHTEGKNAAKKQRDWPGTFLNALKGNWYKLWWLNGDQYELTTQGKQAQLAAQSAKGARADA